MSFLILHLQAIFVENICLMKQFISKYNVQGPRYTSYPTVPYWEEENFSRWAWITSLTEAVSENNPISLYIHLPFCESLCTFCACNKRITKQHSVESPYIQAVLKEWRLYVETLGFMPIIEEIHLGGGTPTFFSPYNLRILIEGIFDLAYKAKKYEFSFEGHPNNTTSAHLEELYNLGFTRVSYGVQDYNPKVQKAINRIQPFENVKETTEKAREIGYTSVGHDLIFGLPFQTLEDIQFSIEKTVALKPDRIAFYSYAHTPWIKGNGQRGFKDEDLPSAENKRQQYEYGKALLEANGYLEIGMDHFALPEDPLFKAMEDKTLHRNFMGYTTTQAKQLIGLGVSAISDSWSAFAQNEKKLEDYYMHLRNNQLPVFRGHLLNKEDLSIRQHILNLMCKFETSWGKDDMYNTHMGDILIALQEMQKDGLIELCSNHIKVHEAGKAFIRNVCMAFDLRLKAKTPDKKIFSMTI
jgi:oxygen-independent coproporphyrinogen-3 oxidase